MSNSHGSKSRNLTEGEVKWCPEQKWYEWTILEKWQTENRSFEKQYRDEVYQRIALSRSFLCHTEQHLTKHMEVFMDLGREVWTWNQWMRLSFYLVLYQVPEHVHTDFWKRWFSIGLLGSCMFFWVCQECRAVTALSWGHLSGSCSQKVALMGDVMSPSGTKQFCLLLVIKKMDSQHQCFSVAVHTHNMWSNCLGLSTPSSCQDKGNQCKHGHAATACCTLGDRILYLWPWNVFLLPPSMNH